MANLLTPADAERQILELMPHFSREDCPLRDAQGRILRETLLADRDMPPYDRVSMDGFALRAASLKDGMRTFRIGSVQAAGMIAQTLRSERDACIEIMTGAVLPAGADCVVPYENCTRDGATVTVNVTAKQGDAVHARGSDHKAGDVLLTTGTRLSGREIAVAAATGKSILSVSARPSIAVVATGDELVDVEMSVATHQIRRSNDYALRAALVMSGYPRVETFHLRDLEHEMEHKLWHILAEYEVLVLCGGVSKGKFDHLPKVLQSLGAHKIFQGIAQRPGKPFWFGMSARKTPVFALPGNPVSSSYVCLHRYVIPALAHASGAKPAPARHYKLTSPVAPDPNLTLYVPAYRSDGAAQPTAAPINFNTSGDFASLVGSDGFVEIPPGEALQSPVGDARVRFRPWA